MANGPELHRFPHLFVEVDPRYFPDDGLRRAEVFEDLQTASGRRTLSEELGFGQEEFVPWQLGAVM